MSQRFGKLHKLDVPQWAEDGVVDGKYVRQIGFQRYNCQRMKRREADEVSEARKRTLKKGCECYITIAYHQVFEDELCQTKHGSVKIVFSDSRKVLHEVHDADGAFESEDCA